MIRKWILILMALLALTAAISASAKLLYEAIPEREVIVIIPTVVAPPTPVPFQPVGPDPSLPAAYSKPLEVRLGPRTAGTALLRLGPAEGYVVVGTLQTGAPVKAVGRDELGAWIAIEFPPNASLRAWLPVAQVLGIDDIAALPVAPLTTLP